MGALERLGVLGGTFDPIHVGHLLMGQTAYEALGLGLVLFVPAGVPPHKRKLERGEAQARLAMTRAAVGGDARFAVSTVDMERPAPHYTVDTLALLAEQYSLGPDSIYFIIGSDSLEQLHTWHRAGELVQRCLLAVIGRPGHPIDLPAVYDRVPQVEGRLMVLDMPAIGISSTLLRRMVACGRSIRYWVPPGVERIIEERGLYCRPVAQTMGGSR
ncbi:MAG: nicotinate (nicotinamide) nucleotide adenylyltransferase [Anaerolineae bacterium]|nr:nicotinate (nicotinamide) nucleotide adenylyltransferase [Anaerolineae bacterium]